MGFRKHGPLLHPKDTRKTTSPTSRSAAELPVQETVETAAPAAADTPEATSSPQTSPRGEAGGGLRVSAPAAAPPEMLIGRSQAKTSAGGSAEASGMAKVVSRLRREAGKSRRAGCDHDDDDASVLVVFFDAFSGGLQMPGCENRSRDPWV